MSIKLIWWPLKQHFSIWCLSTRTVVIYSVIKKGIRAKFKVMREYMKRTFCHNNSLWRTRTWKSVRTPRHYNPFNKKVNWLQIEDESKIDVAQAKWYDAEVDARDDKKARWNFWLLFIAPLRFIFSFCKICNCRAKKAVIKSCSVVSFEKISYTRETHWLQMIYLSYLTVDFAILPQKYRIYISRYSWLLHQGLYYYALCIRVLIFTNLVGKPKLTTSKTLFVVSIKKMF